MVVPLDIDIITMSFPKPDYQAPYKVKRNYSMNTKFTMLRAGAIVATSFIIVGLMGTPVFADSYSALDDAAPAPTVYSGLPSEAPTYLINPSATGVDTIEAFIETPGVFFANSGFTNLNSGWTANIVDPTYAVESGPVSDDVAQDVVIGGVAPTVTVEFFSFTGCTTEPASPCPSEDLTDTYAVTYDNGAYAGDMDASSMLDELQQMVQALNTELASFNAS